MFLKIQNCKFFYSHSLEEINLENLENLEKSGDEKLK